MHIASNLPSQVQQERDFLRPMFEERSAKMEGLSEEDRDDNPARRSLIQYIWLANRVMYRMTCSRGS